MGNIVVYRTSWTYSVVCCPSPTGRSWSIEQAGLTLPYVVPVPLVVLEVLVLANLSHSVPAQSCHPERQQIRNKVTKGFAKLNKLKKMDRVNITHHPIKQFLNNPSLTLKSFYTQNTHGMIPQNVSPGRGLFLWRFSKKSPSETWTHPRTYLVFCEICLTWQTPNSNDDTTGYYNCPMMVMNYITQLIYR